VHKDEDEIEKLPGAQVAQVETPMGAAMESVTSANGGAWRDLNHINKREGWHEKTGILPSPKIAAQKLL
jgi:hypothetical protein